MSDDRIWVCLRKRGAGRTRRLHFDPDCYRLSNAEDVREKGRDCYPPEWPVCSSCAPDHELAGGPEGGLDRNERDVLETLREADAALSTRESRTEARVSLNIAREAVRSLDQRDLVGETYGDDKRIPLYQLSEDDRGQIDPVSTGLLSVFVGVVLLFGYAIALGVML